MIPLFGLLVEWILRLVLLRHLFTSTARTKARFFSFITPRVLQLFGNLEHFQEVAVSSKLCVWLTYFKQLRKETKGNC